MGSKSVCYTQVSLSDYLLSLNEPILAEMMKARESIYLNTEPKLIQKKEANYSNLESLHQETFEEVFGISPEKPIRQQRTRRKHSTVRRITKSR